MKTAILDDEQSAKRGSEEAKHFDERPSHMAGGDWRAQEWEKFESRCRQSVARLNDWKFDRDEANER